MSNGRIAVNFGQMAAGADELRVTAKRLKDRLNELDRAVAPLTATWGSLDNGAYAQYMVQRGALQASIDNIVMIVDRFGVATMNAGQSQHALNNRVKDTFTG